MMGSVNLGRRLPIATRCRSKSDWQNRMTYPRFTKRRMVFAMLLAGAACIIYDYVTYHQQYNAAMSVVSRVGGQPGSLFGRE